MNEIIAYLRKNSSSDKPVSGMVLAERFGLTGQKVREYINQARRDGVPICSARWGYFYSEDKSQIKKNDRLDAWPDRIAGACDRWPKYAPWRSGVIKEN